MQESFDIPVNPQPSNAGKGFAIASLICGIVSLFCFAIITGVLGIVFGSVAKGKGFRGGMATAGIVCGVIGIVSWLIMIIFFGTGLSLYPSF